MHARRNLRTLLVAIAALILTSCPGSTGPSKPGDDSDNDPGIVYETLFPTAVGAKWLYEKDTSLMTSNAGTPTTTKAWWYVDLSGYDSATRVYSLTMTRHIKHIHYYGSPDGKSDLITYRDDTLSFRLRNRANDLERSVDGGATWKALYSSDTGKAFPTASLFVANHPINLKTQAATDWIDSLPTDPLGSFAGAKSYGNTGSTSSEWEFFSPSSGLLESFYSCCSSDPGLPGYLPGSFHNYAEHSRLRGYRIDGVSKGADVDALKYSIEEEY
jgi:hypothetical protein